MNIDLDIYSAVNGTGLCVAYDVEAHYELNDMDNLDLGVLRKMKQEIEELVRKRLNDAIDMREATYSKVKEIDGGLEPTTQPYEVNIYTDPRTKEITVTKRYMGV